MYVSLLNLFSIILWVELLPVVLEGIVLLAFQ